MNTRFLLSLFFLACAPLSAQVAVTASCYGASDTGNDISCTLTLHTSSMVYVHAKRIGDDSDPTITISDNSGGGGLTYTERLHGHINTIACTWECGWSSVDDAQTGAVSGSITVNAHFSLPGALGGPFLLIEVYEFSGVNTSSYFDTSNSVHTTCSTAGSTNVGSITASDGVTYHPTTNINGGGCSLSDTTLLSQAVAYFTPHHELIVASNMGKNPICCTTPPFLDLSGGSIDGRLQYNSIYFQNPGNVMRHRSLWMRQF